MKTRSTPCRAGRGNAAVRPHTPASGGVAGGLEPTVTVAVDQVLGEFGRGIVEPRSRAIGSKESGEGVLG